MRTGSRLALILAVAIVCGAFAAQALAGPGAYVWKKYQNPTAGGDDLYLCARGPGGSVYGAGIRGVGPAYDFWVVKYRASGVRLWSQTWDGPDGRREFARDMVADAAGNVYVCGGTMRTSGILDTAVVKYSAAGTFKWATVYPAGVGDDEAWGIGLDAAGNVYVAGTNQTSLTTSEVFTAKFRATDGVRLWTSRYHGPGQTRAESIAVTAAGACYAAGQIETGHATNAFDGLLVKTSAAGVHGWASTWNGPLSLNDYWHRAKLTPKGGVIVAGTANSSDFAAARYTSAGHRQWARTWSSTGSWSDRCTDLAVARDGGVWVAGTTNREEGDWRAALVKWSASGHRLFARIMGTSTRSADLEAVTTDASGNAYVVGTTDQVSGGWNLLAAKYAPGGRRLWRSTANCGPGSMDGLGGIALGGTGYVYAVGNAGWEKADSRGVVVKIRR
jgi:hypothetical protein